MGTTVRSSLGLRVPTSTLMIAMVASLSSCAPAVDSAHGPRAGATAQAVLEYIGHAAVVIESSSGSRVLIDPYNGVKWMGYSFPPGVFADAVLITHPHYDHDAYYEVEGSPPVFREPGSYVVGDLRIQGIEGEHAGGDRYRGQGLEPFNVVWIVEADGVRFLHVGDNGLPSAELTRAIGDVDVLLTQPFFSASEVRDAYASTGVRVIAPVHYRIPELAVEAFRLPTADDWLADASRVRTSTEQRIRFSRDGLPDSLEYQRLTPSPALEPWPDDLRAAWELVAEADPSEGESLAFLREAFGLAPQVLEVHRRLGEALLQEGDETEAIALLEEALARFPTGDPENTIRIRGLLGERYLSLGRTADAESQYRAVFREPRTYAAGVYEAAAAFLDASGPVWTAAPDLPRPVANNAVVGLEVGGEAQVYSFLGIDETKRWDGVVSSAFRWVVGSDAWEELPLVPGPGRLAGTAEAWGGKLFLFGGYTVAEDGTEASVPSVDIFDPATDSWAAGAPIPVPVDDAVSGVWQDSLIVLVSGWHDTDNVAAVQLYNPATDAWSAGTPISGPPVFGHAGKVVGDRIVYAGGANTLGGTGGNFGNSGPRYRIEPSSWVGDINTSVPSQIAWRRLVDHPGPPRYRAATGSLGPWVVFAGGTDNPYNYDGLGYDGSPAQPSTSVLAFHGPTGAWAEGPPLPEPRMDHRALAKAGGTVALVGGMTAGQVVTSTVFTADAERLQVELWAALRPSP